MSNQEWRERWEQWLDFFVGAMHYGAHKTPSGNTTNDAAQSPRTERRFALSSSR